MPDVNHSATSPVTQGYIASPTETSRSRCRCLAVCAGLGFPEDASILRAARARNGSRLNGQDRTAGVVLSFDLVIKGDKA